MTVSIVTYRHTEADLSALRDSLAAATNVERVITVDNTFDNRGFGKAHNLAIREAMEAGATYHLVVNPDVSFPPGTLEALESYMDAHPDVGILQPKTIYPDGAMQYSARLLPTPFDVIARRFLPEVLFRASNARYELRHADYSRPFDVAYLRGCFLVCRLACLREVGLFDERFFLYPEDIDLCRRVYATETWRCVCDPTVTIVHHHERASYKSRKMLWVHCQNMIRYFNKWGWFFDGERRRINREVLRDLAAGRDE